MEHEQKHGGISNGFVLGLVLGVLITLLLTTKRGRKIIKLLTEEGMEKFSELEMLWEEAKEETPQPPASMQENDEDSEELLDTSDAEEELSEKALEESEHMAVKKAAKSATERKPALHKRFFKGIHRRTVN